MMTSTDFAWAAELMHSKYGAEGHARALRQAEALRSIGRHRAASLWKQIAARLEAVMTTCG
jgi:hypothetical protein